eukprot:5830407-Heterocapsa_arctica.AAC.1
MPGSLDARLAIAGERLHVHVARAAFVVECAAVREVAEVGSADSADVLFLNNVSAHRGVRFFCEQFALPLGLVDAVVVQ